MTPLFIVCYLKVKFCCGATKLKPGQTQEDFLLDYLNKELLHQ